MTQATVYFWILAALTGGSAIATVVTQNIVRSATWLLFTLAGTSAVFFLLGADLVGAIQLLVYVGGTMVLVVFGVMLTAQGPFINMKASAAEWAISATVGILLLGVLVMAVINVKLLPFDEMRDSKQMIPAVVQFAPRHADKKGGQPEDKKADDKTIEDKKSDPKKTEELGPANSRFSTTIGQGFLGVGVGPAHKEGPKVVRANYLLPFELVSVHLLVVLIGAAYLARAKRRRREATVP